MKVMRRRTFLWGVGAGLGAVGLSNPGLAGTARAHTRDRRREPYAPLGSIDVEGRVAEAVVGPDQETAYVAAGNGFVTVDVSDAETPTVMADVRDVASDVENGPMTSILDVKVDGDRLLVSGPAQVGPVRGIVVYDVSDPANPTPATDFFRTGFRIHNCFLRDGYAYLTSDRSLTIVDVRSTSPEIVVRW
jgi:hypothetical protein